ncbi:MAG: hypothetical protein ACQKBY_00910 [Verrucomicrobiales bacterium]
MNALRHLILLAALLLPATLSAQIKKDPRGSLLNSDPDVVYREEFAAEPIELLVVKPGTVYATKKGGYQRGALKVDSKVELVGFTERAYNIRGTLSNGNGVSGWVSPHALASRDKNFVENLQKLYERQIKLRQLIADGQLALGMTPDEVAQVMGGEPTKATLRRTAKGRSGSWEYIEFEEEKHYQLVRDPRTGAVFRQLTHVTKEEKSKTVIEFEDDVVTAIEESRDNGSGKTHTIPAPIFITW